MKVIDFYDNRINLGEVVKLAIETLKRGGIIVYPTDTVYGFGCDASSKRAVDKIFQLKKRDSENPLSVIMRDEAMIGKYAVLSERQKKILRELFPGKFTAVLRCRGEALRKAAAGLKTIGVRIPDYDLTQEISRRFQKPYVTTSVNVAGKAPLVWGMDIIKKYEEDSLKPDLIIDAGKLGSEYEEPQASTVLDLTSRKIKVLRRGGAEFKELMSALRLSK